MSEAKVTLSPKELELVNNADWILTKNLIIQKVYDLFGQVAATYQLDVARFTEFDATPTCTISPKISKGEQYQQLPYVMLDFHVSLLNKMFLPSVVFFGGAIIVVSIWS